METMEELYEQGRQPWPYRMYAILLALVAVCHGGLYFLQAGAYMPPRYFYFFFPLSLVFIGVSILCNWRANHYNRLLHKPLPDGVKGLNMEQLYALAHYNSNAKQYRKMAKRFVYMGCMVLQLALTCPVGFVLWGWG